MKRQFARGETQENHSALQKKRRIKDVFEAVAYSVLHTIFFLPNCLHVVWHFINNNPQLSLQKTIRNELPGWIIPILVKGGADVNGEFPCERYKYNVLNNKFEFCASSCRVGELEEILEKRQEVFGFDSGAGFSPVVVKHLVQAGWDKQTGFLFDAAKDGENALREEIQTLGLNVNFRAKILGNKTALHMASLLLSPKVAQALLACGAEVDLRDTDNRTPLHLVCERPNGFDYGVLIGKFESFRKEHCLLFDEGSDARQRLQCKMIRLLIQNGADIDAKDNRGRTPASLNEYCKVVVEELKAEREFVNSVFTFLGPVSSSEGGNAFENEIMLDALPFEMKKEVCLYLAPNHRRQENIAHQFDCVAERREKYDGLVHGRLAAMKMG